MRWNRIGNLKAEYYRYRLTNALRNPLALENEGVVEITTMLGRNHTRDTIEKNRLAHLGKRHSNETKVKLSLAKLGKNNPRGMLGKHHSEEVKQKMRLLRIGKKMSEETKLKSSCTNESG